jgi:hypothetical protein
MSLDRDAIRAACEAATAGPWYQWCTPWFDVDEGVNAYSEDPHVGHIVAETGPDYADPREQHIPARERSANAAFIAGARSWVPELLGRLERVEEAVAALLHTSRPAASWGEHFEAETRLRVLLAERLAALEEGESG